MGGAPAGDLYVTVHVTPHRLFGRAKNADDLTSTVPVTFPELVLGIYTHGAHVGRHGVAAAYRRAPAAGARSGSAGAGWPQEGDDGRPARHGGGGGARPPLATPRRAPCSPTPRPRRVTTRGPICSAAGGDFSDDTAGCRRAAGMDSPIFVISVAAELAGLHAQTLRSYDRLGLVRPGRSAGGGRRYSARDIALLREVQRLSQEEGVNLAGIKRIIELEQQVGRAARPAGGRGPGAVGRPRRRRAGRGLGARVLPARSRAGRPQPGHRGVAPRKYRPSRGSRPLRPGCVVGRLGTPGTRAALRLAGSHLDHEAHRP